MDLLELPDQQSPARERKVNPDLPGDFPLDELSTLIARVQGMLLTEEQVTHAVELLAEAVCEALPGAHGAGISLMDGDGRRTSTGSTDEVVLAADWLQYRLGRGPCVEAWASGTAIRSDRLALEDRWPGWSGPAARIGIRSVLSVPLRHKATAIGAIKVYSLENHAFDEHSEHLLTLLGGPTATLLAHIQSADVPHRASRELRNAIASRDNTAFARGILMERNGLSADAAMYELIALAHRKGTTLRSASEQIIQSAADRQRN